MPTTGPEPQQEQFEEPRLHCAQNPKDSVDRQAHEKNEQVAREQEELDRDHPVRKRRAIRDTERHRRSRDSDEERILDHAVIV